jgi:hypothetical protein
MQVLVLSPARTGTTSIEAALAILGFKVYRGMKHAYLEAARGKGPNTYPLWSEALDAAYPPPNTTNTNKPAPYSSTDLEKILSPYTAASGWPLSLFPQLALEAYPTAKVILMSRPSTAFSASMTRALSPRLTWWSWNWILPLEGGLIRDCIRCGQRCLNAFSGGQPCNRAVLEERYAAHNELVEGLCKSQPGRELLVFEATQGWGPLCEFLGVDVPKDTPWPREAVGGAFEKQGRMFWMMALAKVVVKVGAVAAVVGAGVWAWRNGYFPTQLGST